MRRTWPKVICTEHLVKFGRVVFEICKWIGRQADMLIIRYCSTIGAKLKYKNFGPNKCKLHSYELHNLRLRPCCNAVWLGRENMWGVWSN